MNKNVLEENKGSLMNEWRFTRKLNLIWTPFVLMNELDFK